MSFRGLLSEEDGASSRRLLVRSLAVALVASAVAAPAAAQMLVGDGSVKCGGPHVISSGDTLSRVSERAYGDPMLYGILADANWDALGGDPEHLTVGMSITIPCIDANGKVLTPEAAAESATSLEAVVTAEGPLTPAELETLFGPAALFPDQVLTSVLVAVTFPLDVVKAGRFVESAAALSDQERAAQAASKPWDDSVRELAAGFPDLVTRMSDNIDWTEQAGEAVVAQTDEVLSAIQRQRAKAQENGYIVDNEAQKVEEVNGKIVISPASAGVVYVPTYDSKVVYTTPVVGAPVYQYGYSGYGYGYVYDDHDWDDALVAGGIILGGAVVLDEIFDDDDWDGWDSDDDIDWDRGDLTIDRDDIDIDRGDINIDDGERAGIGGGDRSQIGDGDRISIGDSDRTQVERGDLANIGDRAGDRQRAGALPANRTSIANAASRDVARQKIETRKATGAAPADLRTSRPATARAPASASRDLTRSRSTTQSAPAISRPKASRTPTARAPSRSSAFQQPSRSRPAVSSSRARGSVGRAGGGRGGGGGGRRR
jgi:hypothetical protein